MEVMFENKTVYTKEILAEFSKEYYKVILNKFRMVVLVTAIIYICATNICISMHGLNLTSVILLLASVVFLLFYFKGHVVVSAMINKNLVALHGESPQFTAKFYNDKLENTTSHSNITIEYGKINKIIETKNMYILIIAKQYIILLKNGFTIGDSNIFKSFIRTKCTNAFAIQKLKRKV